ncbi:hypothetical protein FQZ97_625130 [compost metagenome]
MYSGTTFRTKSGRVMGVHQKIDRVARRHLKHHLGRDVYFPSIVNILHFEGLNGPDGIKRKSPAKDEPWHYVDPSKQDDTALLNMINDHIENLATALKTKNDERAAFEAAWMAHAIVDGLTPAHHYPLEAKLEELRGGQGLETRTSTKEKLILPGKTRRHQLRNNWEYWGTNGIFTTHLAFELGVASTIAPVTFKENTLPDDAIERLKQDGFSAMFTEALRAIDAMKMYDEFAAKNWTRHLANETRKTLIPDIINTVILGWYQAVLLAEKKA